jgi:hypothetical protein
MTYDTYLSTASFAPTTYHNNRHNYTTYRHTKDAYYYDTYLSTASFAPKKRKIRSGLRGRMV